MEGEHVDEEVWSFVNTASGWRAVLLASLRSHPSPAELQVSPFLPGAWAAPAYMILAGTHLDVFRWVADGAAFPLLAVDAVQSYTVQDDAQGAFLTVQTGQEDGQKIPLTYRWDRLQERFVEWEGYDFAFAEHEAERLLFQEGDFDAAAAWIEQFLDEAPTELPQAMWCDWQKCEYRSNWYYPHLRYLLGLAYEMAGFPEQATRVYYELWRDDPADLFGLVAGLKLEPISK